VDRAVQNTVPQEDYGSYFALFNFSFLFFILLDAGLTNYNNKTIAQHSQLLGKYFADITVIKTLLSVVYFIAVITVAYFLGYDLYQLKLLAYLSVNMVLTSFIQYFRSNIAALQHFRTDSILSVLDRTLMIIFVGFLLWGSFSERFTIETFILSQTVALLITAIISFLWVYRQTSPVKFRFNKTRVLSILKNSYPFAVLMALMGIYTRIDAVMIERLLPEGKAESGIYASAYRLLDAVSMFAALFSSLLLPMFSRMLKDGKPVEPLAALAGKVMALPSIALITVCIFFSNDIMGMMYVNNTTYSSGIFALLMCSFLSLGMIYVFGTLLTAGGKVRHLNFFAVICTFLNICLNFALIPHFKAMGATVATLITQTVFSTLCLVTSVRIFSFTWNLKLICKILSYCVLISIAGYSATLLDTLLIYKLLIVAGASFLLILLFRFFNLSKLRETLSKSQ
jgi:O-antigen/teichoic acid export membrane protein